ncbi:Pcmt1-prov protein [Auriculariales sp. MPI-PUGE-AT-0066]|nr:Pcmt1-prov protein [Auriculariales sp. MPI-PUGE-AT-0066]
MAWTCSGRTNVELVLNMARHGMVKSQRVVDAMKATDRACYVRRADEAYEDSPQTIGHGATISAPHMHAHAAEALEPFLQPGNRVLDVGSGSGVLVALFARLVGPEGRVVGVDHVQELVDWSRENVQKDGLVLSNGNGDAANTDGAPVKLICADGRLGWPADAPYDAIHVGAAAPELAPALIAQLKSPGRMFIPVGTHSQEIIQVDKDREGKVSETTLFGVRYVPLTDLDAQIRSY